MSVINTESKSTWNDILISLLLCANFVPAVFNIRGSMFILLFLCFLLRIKTWKYMRVTLSSVCVCLLICILFIFSFIQSEFEQKMTSTYLLYFLAYGAFVLLIIPFEFNSKNLFKIVSIYSFVGNIIILIRGYTDFSSEEAMGMTYALLPCILVCIYVIGDKYSLLTKLFAIGSLILSLKFILGYGSRGILISLAVFGVLYILCRFIKYVSIRWILIFITSFLAILVSNNLIYIFSKLQYVLNKFNISVYAINKTLKYWELGKFDNGRMGIWNRAFSGILDRPILGHGIGTFEVSKGVHTHNLYLQCGWELGIIGIIAMSILTLLVIIFIINQKYTANGILLIILFTCSIVSLQVSSVYWMNVQFWMLIKLLLINKSPSTNITNYKYNSKALT